MIRKHLRFKRLVLGFAFVVAIAAFSAPAVQAKPITARTDNGFNWSDAGIGASFVFGGALVLLTALALGRRYRSRFDRSGLATS